MEFRYIVRNEYNRYRYGVLIRWDNYGTGHHIHIKNCDIHDINAEMSRFTGEGIMVVSTGTEDGVPTNFDDVLHKKGSESMETLAEARFNYQTFCMFDQMIQNHWKHHNTLVGFGMDHGCHDRDDGTGRGTHGDNSPEDRNIVHLYKIHPAAEN